MRIISGKNRGRKIITPNDLPLRPTTDYAKESLFNILSNYINIGNTDVLDLFAGTGNISYEFVSRGCHSVTSIDHNTRCINFIRHIAEKLHYDNINILHSDCFYFLNKTNEHWDLIFADPPYDLKSIEEIYRIIFTRHLLKTNGLFILEHGKSHSFSKFMGFLEQRSYGAVNFSFFRKTTETHL